MPAAIVVGGGIVGASIGYHLARTGVETTLVDRRDDGRATAAGAGILSPATSSRTGSEPWFRFAIEAVDHYPSLVEQLRDHGIDDTGYAEPGLLSVAVDARDVAEFDAALDRIRDRQDRYDRPRKGSIRQLSGAGAADRFPALREPSRALYYEDAARVDGRTFTDALLDAARSEGLTVERASAQGIAVENGRVEGVVVDGDRRATDAVAIAGGAWSSRFGRELGVEIPVAPQRGQIAHLDCDPLTLDPAGWPMVGTVGEGYLVPWPDGRVAAGATRESGSGYDPRRTAKGARDALDDALRVAPGLADATLGEVRVGLRPASADDLPVIGPVPDVEGAYLATGHGPTGLQLGPFTGKVVAELIAGESPSADLAAFSVERFE